MFRQVVLKTLPPAPKHDIESIQNWYQNHNDTAINTPEQTYLSNTHDLFSLIPRDKSPLCIFLERSLAVRLLRLWRKKTTNPSLPLYDDTTYMSDKRIGRFVNVVVIVIGIAMLICPIWILNCLQGQRERLATITGFVVLFLGIVGGATVAKIWEALAATAA